MQIERFVRFGAVGAATAVLYFGLLALFLDHWRLDYRIAVTIAYATSVAFHFFSNRRFTFGAHGSDARMQLARYLILVLVSYAITIGVVMFAVERMRLDPTWGSALAIVITTGVGFLASAHWVFRVGR